MNTHEVSESTAELDVISENNLPEYDKKNPEIIFTQKYE